MKEEKEIKSVMKPFLGFGQKKTKKKILIVTKTLKNSIGNY